MRRNTVLLMMMAIALIIGSYSCKKEGVYNPKKKISRIYSQYQGEAKQLLEKWTWTENSLSMIEAGDNSYSWQFEYIEGRIDKIVSTEGYYYVFSYNKNLLQQIELFSENGTLVEWYEFEHTKNKITTVTYIYYGYKDNRKKQNNLYLSMALRCFLPQPIADDLSLTQKHNSSADRKAAVDVTTYDYVWDKHDNIKSLYVSYPSGAYEEYSYEYDDYHNPFYYSFLPNGISGDLLYSKNNITYESRFQSSKGSGRDFDTKYEIKSETNYDIKYEKKFPVEINAKTTSSTNIRIADSTYRSNSDKYSTTMFYTYQ
jgi:hypothetical protein